jgi:cellulose biosynthesis protein BcsQ
LQSVIADKGQEIGAPYLMAIRPGIAVREAQAMQESLYSYAPRPKPAQDYKKLYQLIMEG